jgi:uncharacterized damage-inducible protein DinB
MKFLFEYNWKVREEWLDLCGDLPFAELIKTRVGGTGSFLTTFLHIIDVEYSWIRSLQGEPDVQFSFENYRSITQVNILSQQLHSEVVEYLENWSSAMENKAVKISWSDETYTHGEVLRHLIAHEIHHIGQLSVWARELGIKPVSANFIGRHF